MAWGISDYGILVSVVTVASLSAGRILVTLSVYAGYEDGG